MSRKKEEGSPTECGRPAGGLHCGIYGMAEDRQGRNGAEAAVEAAARPGRERRPRARVIRRCYSTVTDLARLRG